MSDNRSVRMCITAALCAAAVGALVACAPAPTPSPAPTRPAVSVPAPTVVPPTASLSAPTATPQPGPIPQGPRTVTLADNGNTITLKVGETFLLMLGADREWEIEISDLAVVSRVPNITVIRGAQGVYAARSIGKATLSANGRVNCPQGQICPQNILVFRLNVVVE